MELRHYLSILWKWAWLLILAPLLAGMVSLMVSQRMQPVYRATTTLLVSPAGGSSSLNYSSLLTSERVARTYAKLLTKRPLLEEVISSLQLNLTPNQLAGKITVVQPSDTQLIELHVKDSDPQLAITIANSVATSFLRQNDRRRSDRAVYVEIVEPAAMPAYKLRPRVVFNTFVAAFAGLTLTVGFIFLLDYLDDTLTRPESVEQALRIPTLATIPPLRRRAFLKASRNGVPFTALQPMSPFAEAYRMLRTNVRFAGTDSAISTLLVASALPKEGKTTTVANLGVVMAQAGIKVLVVDSDLRGAKLHQVFNLPNQHGLTDLLLADAVPVESCLLETTIPNLRLLPSGPLLPTPSELLSSGRMRELISHLSTLTDILLFDCPPVLAVTDAVVIASHVDGAVLVIEGGRTSREEVRKALHSLQSARVRVLGAVLTRCKEGIGYYYGRYSAELGGIDDAGAPLSISLPVRELFRSSSPDRNDGSSLQVE